MADDMSAETFRPIDSTRYSSRSEARSLLSQVLETQVSPEGRFKNAARGEIVGLEKIGNVIGVLSKAEDNHYSTYTYDSQGNVTEISLDPSLKELIESLEERSSINYIRIRDTDHNLLERYFTNLGYSRGDSTILIKQWLNNTARFTADRDGDASITTMKSQNNFFIPTLKLVRKEHIGSKVKRIYDKPKTPYQRVLEHSGIAENTKQNLKGKYLTLNPATLLRQINSLGRKLTKS